MQVNGTMKSAIQLRVLAPAENPSGSGLCQAPAGGELRSTAPVGGTSGDIRAPRVRAITAFVRLDRASWEKQIAEALVVLRKTQKEFELAGYQVESLRITTQPVGELIAGLSEDDAVALLKKLDELSAKEKFIPNVGPGMMHDTD